MIPNRTGCCRGEFRFQTPRQDNTTAEQTIEIVEQTLLIKEAEEDYCFKSTKFTSAVVVGFIVSFLFLKIIVVVSRVGAESVFTTVYVLVLRRNSTNISAVKCQSQTGTLLWVIIQEFLDEN